MLYCSIDKDSDKEINNERNVCRTFQKSVFRRSGGGGLETVFTHSTHIFDSFPILCNRNYIALLPLTFSCTIYYFALV